jgi:hypothetical protein
MLRTLPILAMLLGCTSPLFAQPVAGKAQPDFLAFGNVRVGATVEASVRVFADGKNTTGLELRVEAPAFVRVLSKELGTQEFGQAGTKIFGDVALAIDTRHKGEYAAPVHVHIGKQETKIPVRVSVLPAQPGLSRVVVADTPFERFSTSDAKLFSPWLEVVKEARLDVHYLLASSKQPVLRDLRLREFDVILLGCSGLMSLCDQDRTRLKAFLDQGGRVVVAANHFYQGSAAKANQIAGPYGLQMADIEPVFGNNRIILRPSEIRVDPFTRGVKELDFLRPSPIDITDPRIGRLLAEAPALAGKGLVAAGRKDKGEVIVLGTSLWWSWVGRDHDKGGGNARLLQNLLTRPRDGPSS